MNSKTVPLITTNRCILRLPELTEVPLMCDFAAKNKNHLSKWEQTQSDIYYTENYWQEKIIQIQAGFLSDKSCFLNIYMKDTNELIGMVNYNGFIRGCFHSCTLGYKISGDMQGKGLITESLQSSIKYIFETLNLHRISANYMPHNKASAKVLDKCGFTQEGIAEDYLYINSKWERHVLTSLINHDWQS